MKKALLLVWAMIWSVSSIASGLQAKFSSAQCESEVYSNGFDSYDELDTWQLDATNWYYTWDITKNPRNGAPAFSTINPSSLYSLCIEYSDKSNQDESLTSPAIAIPTGATCSFYTSFHGAFAVLANITLNVVVGDVSTEVFNGLKWSDEYDYVSKNWMKITVDLAEYAGQSVKFRFNYKGFDGDDVYIDDFKITAVDNSEGSKITVNEGGKVDYTDLSEGEPTEWAWSFPGGTPATSTEQNPTVIYKEAGTYSATLIVKAGEESSTYTRTDFVTVVGVAPKAKIGFPAEAYLSPFALAYVPTNTDLQFTDLSDGFPSAWEWKIPGSSKPTTNEQHPVVNYPNEGLYGISLKSTNKTGNDSDIYIDAIQAGGEQYIWNITPDESSQLAQLALGWYGNYGGSNWLDIHSFAEGFHKPASTGLISEVDIYFASVTTVTPNAEIKVAIHKADAAGLPGEEVASTVVLAKDLKYSDDTYLPTTFTFEQPVAVDDDFFVVISGFPNETNELYQSDDIAMFCVPERSAGGNATTYNYLVDYDEDNEPTGISWYKNDESPTSFAVAPKFKYAVDTSITNVDAAMQIIAKATVVAGALVIETNGNMESLSIYDTSGQQVKVCSVNSLVVDINELPKGIYVVRMVVNGEAYAQKIMK